MTTREITPAEQAALAAAYPLDFTLQYPPRREYFQDCFRTRETADAAIAAAPEMLVYAHVPFCQSKCYFCNFAVDIRANPDLHRAYTNLLCEQLAGIDALLPAATRIPGIDIGGGTPTLLQAEQLAQILAAMKPLLARATRPDPLSIETTPRIAATCPDRLHALREGGVTRISMGVQSANAATLAAVNRKEQAAMTEQAVANMRRAGFSRINVDIIFALPGQNADDWRASVQHAIDLGVDSITTYDCLYRGKGRALTKRTADKPTPAAYGALYDVSYHMLADAGFHAAYGSVNFSRHSGETGTSPYFEGRLFDHTPYLGAGNYASSMVGDDWWFAPHGVNDWMKAVEGGAMLPRGDAYRLPRGEAMAKQVLLSLNFGTISRSRFENRFGAGLEETYGPQLAYGVRRGWLAEIPDGYGVAPGRFGHMPEIRALFYTAPAIEWLVDGIYSQAKPGREMVAA